MNFNEYKDDNFMFVSKCTHCNKSYMNKSFSKINFKNYEQISNLSNKEKNNLLICDSCIYDNLNQEKSIKPKIHKENWNKQSNCYKNLNNDFQNMNINNKEEIHNHQKLKRNWNKQSNCCKNLNNDFQNMNNPKNTEDFKLKNKGEMSKIPRTNKKIINKNEYEAMIKQSNYKKELERKALLDNDEILRTKKKLEKNENYNNFAGIYFKGENLYDSAERRHKEKELMQEWQIERDNKLKRKVLMEKELARKDKLDLQENIQKQLYESNIRRENERYKKLKYQNDLKEQINTNKKLICKNTKCTKEKMYKCKNCHRIFKPNKLNEVNKLNYK